MSGKEKGFLEEVVQLVNDAAGMVLDVSDEDVATPNAPEVTSEAPEAKQRSKRGTFVATPKAPKVTAPSDGDDGDDGDDGAGTPAPAVPKATK